MRKITAVNLVTAIHQLPKNQDYNYINPRTKGLIRIVDVILPEGAIYFKRWNPARGETADQADTESISSQLIWRVANAFSENQPINIDRVLGASYNTRSVIESLIAHTPQFHYCYPGRVEDIAGNVEIKSGHKHLIWIPSEPHKNGVLSSKETNIAISEIPYQSVAYDLTLPPALEELEETGVNIDIVRRHAQIQVALYLIGMHLDFRTWIAKNDTGIIFNDKPLIEQRDIVKNLEDEPMVHPYDGAVHAGRYIDCIWFQNHKLMPAIMEVEHSTGVTSGLTRMLNFQATLPKFHTRYVIVASDSDRKLVVREANKEIFKPLNVLFFPYSAVEELYYLCQKRNLSRQSVSEEFLDCFMEKTVGVI